MSIGLISVSLNYVATLLKQNKICSDVSTLTDTASKLSKENKVRGRCYYKLERLIFNTPSIPRNSIPSKTKDLKIVFDIEICEAFGEQKTLFNPVLLNARDCSFSYNCSITAIGKTTNSSGDPMDVVSSIHLDFDNPTNADFIHPDFHMTFGGKSMTDYFEGENNDEVFGKALLLTSPRLPHPPMDAILGIDFILRNYFKKELYDKVFCDSKYRQAVRQSQERLWKPYMLALAGHWCQFNGCIYNDNNSLAQKYNPNLIK